MPFYNYTCSKCEKDYSLRVSMDDYDKEQPCTECGTENPRKWNPCVNMIFKGDGWSTKNERIKAQMRKKNQKLDAKQYEMKRDTKVGGRLVPNVDGERVDTWAEASKLAKSQGKSEATYAPMVAKEQAEKGK